MEEEMKGDIVIVDNTMSEDMHWILQCKIRL
jgi:hypothetical protein